MNIFHFKTVGLQLFVLLLVFAWPPTGSSADSCRLIDNGDGTVTDPRSGLMWSASVSRTKLSWSKAKEAASRATIGGHKDWRISTRDELVNMGTLYTKCLDSLILNLRNGEYLTDTENGTSIYVVGIHPKIVTYSGEGYGSNAAKYDYVVYYNGSRTYPFYYWLVRQSSDKGNMYDRSTITAVQIKLRKLGYETGPVDGVWGKITKAALTQYQKDNGLVASDGLNESTLEKLQISP